MVEANSVPATRVVLTDDHGMFRHAVRGILNPQSGYSVVGEAADAESTLELVEREKPDILVLDIGLPSKSGIEVIRELRKRNIPTKVVVLSMYEDELKVEQALLGGARSYMLKNSSPEEFLEALNAVRGGEVYLPARYQHLKDKYSGNGKSAGKLASLDPLAILSPRERELFFMIVQGQPNREIAGKLTISPRTVETHRARVIKKLGLKTNADLIRYAVRNGLITA